MIDPLIFTPLNGSAAGISTCAKQHPCSPLILMGDLPAIAKPGKHHHAAVKLFLFFFGIKFYTTTPHYALFEINMKDCGNALNITVKLDEQKLQFLQISQGHNVAGDRI